MTPAEGAPDAPHGHLPAARIGQQLDARYNDRVYQAGGDQHIYSELTPAPAAVKNTLPRDNAAFTGRRRELDQLLQTLGSQTGPGGTLAIHAIDGMPGVGKTSLAVHAGHQLESRFPDGQLFVDLHAHTAGQGPVQPAEVLHALLAADGMRAAQIPAGLDARAAQWRSRMAGKRVLLILDNAAGHLQVEPLLPGAPGCLVLITSRRRLTGLCAQHAALPLSLDTLPVDWATELFVRLTGRDFSHDEEHAVADLVALCGNLPLAITLLAAKMRPEPLWSIAALVSELSETCGRLESMCAEDLAVAAAFELSYRDLPRGLQQLFRHLGMHPGLDIDAYAAAALDNAPVDRTRRQLELLYDDHLIDQPTRGRYRMHDLIREYAGNLAGTDPAPERHRSITRVLNYYQHTTCLANQQLARRTRANPAPPTTVPSTAAPVLRDQAHATAWLNAEKANLLACVPYAARHGQHRQLVGLTAALAAFVRHSGPWHQAIAMHQAAAAAAEHLGDDHEHARSLDELGVLQRMTGEHEAAVRSHHQALAIHRQLDDRLAEADSLNELGVGQRITAHYVAAARAHQQALAIYRALGDRFGQAAALKQLAVVWWLRDEYAAAIRDLSESLMISQDIDDRLGQADALHGLGFVRRLTDEYPAAATALAQSLAIYQDQGARLGEANALCNLGCLGWLTNHHETATRPLRDSLRTYRDLGDRLGQANALKHLGIVARLAGDYPHATDVLNEAMAIYHDLHDTLGLAAVLQQLGIVARLAGEYPTATRTLSQAAEIYRDLDSRRGQAEVFNSLGALLLEQGNIPRALEHFQRALRLAREIHSPLEQANSLEGTGRCARQRGDPVAAAHALHQALAIYSRIGCPEAARVTADLKSLTR